MENDEESKWGIDISEAEEIVIEGCRFAETPQDCIIEFDADGNPVCED